MLAKIRINFAGCIALLNLAMQNPEFPDALQENARTAKEAEKMKRR
jgi:hypothetical protein